MAFKKRKYGNYPAFELPDAVSSAAMKRLQAAIGTGLFTQTSKGLETPEDLPEVPETPTGEDESSQD